MNEYEFLVKIEGYKETQIISHGSSLEDARQKLRERLNKQGFMDIQYIEELIYDFE